MTIEEMAQEIKYYGYGMNMEYHNDWGAGVFTDGDVEYQIRDYSNGEVKSILVRFCKDETHTYIEVCLSEFDYTDDFLSYVFGDELLARLEDRTVKAMMDRIGADRI